MIKSHCTLYLERQQTRLLLLISHSTINPIKEFEEKNPQIDSDIFTG